MALQIVQWDDSGKKLKRSGTLPDRRVGRTDVDAGVTTLTITFGTALPNTNYVVTPTWQNTEADPPQFQPLVITAFATTGFSVSWNSPTDSANYKINWVVLEQG